MWNYFSFKPIPYELRKGNVMYLPPVQPIQDGINSLLFRGSSLCNTLPREIKESNSTKDFQAKIKEIRNVSCTSSVCQRRI